MFWTVRCKFHQNWTKSTRCNCRCWGVKKALKM